MYKKFTLKEISTIQNNFIPHLLDVIKREFKKESDRSIKSLLKKDLDFGKTGQEAFYFDRGNIIFKIYLEENGALHCYDEVDAIEIEVSSEERSRLDRLITNYAQHKRQTEQRSINDILQDEFSQGKFLETLGKPYLVYDIETSLINDDLEETEFYIGYYMEESQPGKTEYICITKETLPAFVDKMLNYE
ncbi:hypothetical protein J5893_06185 [bacterium]|nr:hypothetical protein [bacterium]